VRNFATRLQRDLAAVQAALSYIRSNASSFGIGGDAFEDHASRELLQNLVDGAVERLLAKARRSMDDNGPIRICVEHCRAWGVNDGLWGASVPESLCGRSKGDILITYG
jgi:hypothetical protein